MAAGSPGSVRPVHTTGAARRRRGMRASAAERTEVGMTGIGAVSSTPWRGLGAFAPSFTRKLAWLTMTWAGSLGTRTVLSTSSSNPGDRPPVEERGVLVSTLI